MIAYVDSNNSKICKIGHDSKYAINCKIGIHLTPGVPAAVIYQHKNIYRQP